MPQACYMDIRLDKVSDKVSDKVNDKVNDKALPKPCLNLAQTLPELSPNPYQPIPNLYRYLYKPQFKQLL